MGLYGYYLLSKSDSNNPHFVGAIPLIVLDTLLYVMWLMLFGMSAFKSLVATSLVMDVWQYFAMRDHLLWVAERINVDDAQ